MDFEQLGQKTFCACGRTHTLPLRRIRIEAGIISNLAAELAFLGKWEQLLIVADENTWDAAGAQVEKALSDTYSLKTVIFPATPRLRPDEESCRQVLTSFHLSPELLVAVGSGTITDLVRYVAAKLERPFISIPTAPSMDGYASTVAAMTFGGFKVTVPAKPALALFCDLDVLIRAPLPLLAAGVGDLLGKYTAHADWLLARELKEEYYCPTVANLVRKAVASCAEASQAILARQPEAVKKLTEGLLLSGIGILLVGNSRPASGAEHLLSHFWGMKEYLYGREERLHGEKVGVGAILMAKAYRYLLELAPERLQPVSAWRTLGKSWEEYQVELKKVYGPLTGELAIMKQPVMWGQRQPEDISRLPQALAQVKANCPDSEFISATLAYLGAPVTYEDLGLPRTWVREGILYAQEVRERYTILTLLSQLGLLTEAAQWLVSP